MIATANNRDKGVNELSSALKRRFNVVVLPLPATLEEETAIVVKRVQRDRHRPAAAADRAAPTRRSRASSRIFRELRDGQTLNGKLKLKIADRLALDRRGDLRRRSAPGPRPAISATARSTPQSLAANLVGAVVKDPVQDTRGAAGISRDRRARARRLVAISTPRSAR